MNAGPGSRLALLATAVALLAIAGVTAQTTAASTQASTVKVGIIYSRTGPLCRLRRQVRGGSAPRHAVPDARARTRSTATRSYFSFNDDGGVAANAVTTAKDLIGQGYKIIGGATSSGVGLALAPIAAQNKVLFISGPGGERRHHRREPVHVPLRPPDATRTSSPRRRSSGRASARRSSSSLRTTRSARATSPPSRPCSAAAGHTARQRARAADRDRLHAVRAAGEAGEPGPAVRRLGRHDRARRCGRRSTSRACSARPRSRPVSPSGRRGDVRPGRDHVPVALRLGRAEQQGQRLARQRRCASATRCRTSSRRTGSSPRR